MAGRFIGRKSELMRNGTKIRKLIFRNKLIISEGENMKVDIIITNNSSGNSHIVTGKNFTDALNKAVSDTSKLSIDGDYEF